MHASLKYALVRLVAGRKPQQPAVAEPTMPVTLSEDELRQVSGGASAPRGSWAKVSTTTTSREAPRGSW